MDVSHYSARRLLLLTGISSVAAPQMTGLFVLCHLYTPKLMFYNTSGKCPIMESFSGWWNRFTIVKPYSSIYRGDE
jgi:hypothetical protein